MGLWEGLGAHAQEALLHNSLSKALFLRIPLWSHFTPESVSCDNKPGGRTRTQAWDGIFRSTHRLLES